MHFQYIPYIWILLASAAVSAALGVYGWRHRTVPGATFFVLLMLLATMWALANALEMAGTDLPAKLLWANVQYMLGTIGPVAWLSLVLEYTGREKWLTRRTLALLTIEPAITLILIWTDQFHGLVRRNVYLDTAGPFPVVGKTYGPWFWIHVGYSYLLALIAVLLLIKAVRIIPSFYRGQPIVMLIGLFVPMVANGLYVLGYSPIPRHDVAPALLSLSGLVAAWGIFRYRLLDLVPVARHTVVENMHDGVIVLDAQQRIADLNPAAQRILEKPASQLIGTPVAQAFDSWPSLLRLCRDGGESHKEISVGAGEAQRYYDVHTSAWADRHDHPIGCLIVLHDITERKQNQSQLLVQQQRVAVMQDREQLARELHDGLAHDLAALCLRMSRWHRLLEQDPA